MGEPESGFGLNTSMTRAEMIEAWREQRRDRRSRPTASDEGAAVDGFALRKWRKAGVFGAESVARVEQVLRELLRAAAEDGGAPEWARATIRRCLDGQPTAELLTAVRAFLETGGFDQVVAVLTVVHEAALPWLSPVGTRRLAIVCEPDAAADSDTHPTDEEDASGAFALHRALGRRDMAELSASQVRRVVPWAPMPIVDDLIETGVLGRDHAPWVSRADEAEQQYLLARLAPEQLEMTAARLIGWDEPVEREMFLAGEAFEPEEGTLYDLLLRVAEGDVQVLKELESMLPRPLVLRLRRIQDGAVTGTWDADIIADRGLWRLVCALWEPKAAVNPVRGPLYALVALRQAYDLICRGDKRKAAAQVGKLIDHEQARGEHVLEAWNMSAYLALLEEDLDSARIALTRIAGESPKAAENLRLVEHRLTVARNDREHPSNPYLELGLPHGSEFWKQRYRDLRREYAQDRAEAARLNRAMHRIQQAEQAENWFGFFVLPLNPETFRLPYAPPVSLVPPLAPMPRRTGEVSAADLETVRRRAVADLLPALLTAPRRPDRQHRTMS